MTVHEREGAAIEEWEARRRGGRHQATDTWLVYELASWTVHVPLNDRTDPDDVLDKVRPYQTEEGFVIVEVAEPADLAEGYGEAGGPQLAFGDQDPLPDFVRPNQAACSSKWRRRTAGTSPSRFTVPTARHA